MEGVHDEDFEGRGSTLATSESPSPLNQYSATSTVDLPDQQVFLESPAPQETSPTTSTPALVEPTTRSPAEAIGMASSITEDRDVEEVLDTSRHSPSRLVGRNKIKDMTHVLSQSRRIPRYTPRPDTLHTPPKRTIPLEKEVRPFRGGMQNGYTRWYKSFGNGPLVGTPVCQHAKIGDLFVHSYPGGAEQWLFDEDEQWVVARAGDIHPIFAGRYLSFRNPLEPSWVTHHTYKSYEAVARKEHVANM
ncbi:hypothetical protein EIP86_006993 [Pleurotus ostreatoroseus]|nr:hypothetical protein EIP86_006993 [Pleurotus ostreatoroseus]